MKRIQSVFTMALALAVVFSLIPAAVSADEGSTTGQFAAANATPSILAVGLYETDHTTAVTAMTPNLEYAAKVTVSDANTLADLDTVKVTIFHDSDGDDAPGDVPGAGDPQNAAILTYTVATNSWSIDAGGSTMWALVTASCSAPALTGSSGDWWFHFVPGKVATESSDWDAFAVATDDVAASGSAYDASDYDMNWYGEITVSTANVDWGALAPGADYTIQTNISVNYLANGGFNQQVRADATWAGASNNATLDEADAPSAHQFCLKADDTATLGTAVQVLNASYTSFDSGAQTTESGMDETANSLWLKLGTPFANDTYSGSIYYGIVNDGIRLAPVPVIPL